MSMPINSSTSFTIPPQVMSRLVGDETVLLDLASGMYFGIDGVGRRIWESVAAGMNCGDIALAIASEYDVELDQARDDVLEFLSSLAERGLVLADQI